MVVAELLGMDDMVEISLHKLLDEIDFSKVMQQQWVENVKGADDVLVVKVLEELDFMEGTEAEHGVVQWCDALDSDLVLSREVDGQADDAICAFSDDMEWLTSGSVPHSWHVYGHKPTSVYVDLTADASSIMPTKSTCCLLWPSP